MLWRLYKQFLVSYPILSQAATAVSIGALGDVVSQKVVENKEWDPVRTIRFGSLGLFIAPPVFKWFVFLERRFGKTGLEPMKKMLLDQALMGPTVNTFVLVYLETLRGSNLDVIKMKMQTTLPEILANNYKVWPAVQLVNFYFVPLQLKILFTSSVAFFWNIYIAFTLQSDAAERRRSHAEVHENAANKL